MFKEQVKSLIPSYILTGIKEAKWEKSQLKKLAIGKQQAQQLLKENQDIKIDLGSGARKGKNGWTTVDICDGCDLFWNICLPFPLPDNSISQIYSSHVLEHFYYKDTLKLIKESYRLLKPNGIFRVCVPNAKIFIDAYLNSQQLELNGMEDSIYFDGTNTNIDYLNFMAYMGGEHKYMFDEKNLLAVLKQGGFKEVKLTNFDPEIDLISRKKDSLFAIAIK